MPSYTCYSVAASVVKAGLRPRIVDISPDTLDYDPAELEPPTSRASSRSSRRTCTAARATCHRSRPWLARQRGLPDRRCGPGHGGAVWRVAGAGTWGDAGLFSFDKGKNVSAIDGGVIVTSSDELAAALRQRLADLPAPGVATSAVHVVKAIGVLRDAASVALRHPEQHSATRPGQDRLHHRFSAGAAGPVGWRRSASP